MFSVFAANLQVGNILPVGAMPEGTVVCCLEEKTGDRGRLARASGQYTLRIEAALASELKIGTPQENAHSLRRFGSLPYIHFPAFANKPVIGVIELRSVVGHMLHVFVLHVDQLTGGFICTCLWFDSRWFYLYVVLFCRELRNRGVAQPGHEAHARQAAVRLQEGDPVNQPRDGR